MALFYVLPFITIEEEYIMPISFACIAFMLMKKDDLLIMVSDGVMDSDREDLEGKWLERDIKNIKTKNTETIADFIIQKAIEKYGERERDDLSVLVAKIH